MLFFKVSQMLFPRSYFLANSFLAAVFSVSQVK